MFIYRVNIHRDAAVNFNYSKIIADFQGNFHPFSCDGESQADRAIEQ